MSSGDKARPYFLLTLLFALWAGAFLYGFFAFYMAEPEASGLAWGANRIRSFLGWQGIAGLLALWVFALSRAWGAGTSVRRLARVPLGLALCLMAAIAGVIVWASAMG